MVNVRARWKRTGVLLFRPGKASKGTRTRDLSSTGCRVALPATKQLTGGQVLQIAVDVDHGATVWADGTVVWVDEAAQEAALQFTRLDPLDAQRIDWQVYSALTAQAGRG